MNTINYSIGIAYLIFAAIALGEFVLDRVKIKKKSLEPLANFAVFGISRIYKKLVTNGLEFIVLSWFSAHAFLTLEPLAWHFSSVFAILATLFFVDFGYYLKHLSEHYVRILWQYHSVHHSSEEFDLSTATRLPWFGGITSSLFYAPLALFGFDPMAIIAYRSIVNFYQFWIHTEKIGRLRGFDLLFNSPANHRVHHGSNKIYLDKNLGGILMIWDHFFGTYQAEIEKPTYGLTKKIDTKNPFIINFYEPIKLFKELIQNRNLARIPTILFGRPN